jgi:F420-non-reducing hydrogenase large subunit
MPASGWTAFNYQIENGLIARAELIIPTVHNVLAIERALRVAARR